LSRVTNSNVEENLPKSTMGPDENLSRGIIESAKNLAEDKIETVENLPENSFEPVENMPESSKFELPNTTQDESTSCVENLLVANQVSNFEEISPRYFFVLK
jgi:hypothetical protein